MFDTGDYIVYGNMGVCQVQEILEQYFEETKEQKLVYKLLAVMQHCTIFAPVDTKTFMRRAITLDEANRLIETIPTVQTKACNSKITRELEAQYKEYFNCYDCADLLELAMSIYSKKKGIEQEGRKFGSMDERYMKRAEELLFWELSIALEVPVKSIPDYISARLNQERAWSL